MPAKWVIHTVGPVWAKTIDKSDQLASCYRTSLHVADEIGARTIAFPTISAGVYGYPMDEAAAVALATVVAEGARLERVKRVRFVLFDAASLAAHRRALEAATGT